MSSSRSEGSTQHVAVRLVGGTCLPRVINGAFQRHVEGTDPTGIAQGDDAHAKSLLVARMTFYIVIETAAQIEKYSFQSAANCGKISPAMSS
jgi:hypothetical protein